MNDNKALEALDKAKNYKALTGTPIDDDIIEAFELALVELAEIKKRIAEKIAKLETDEKELEDSRMSPSTKSFYRSLHMARKGLLDYILKGEPK